jgi:NADH-quinone oxidoreductase subunit L
MFRLVILTFLGEHKESGRIGDVHESPRVMTVPLIVLAVLSIWVFYSFNPFGTANSWFEHAIQRPGSSVPAAIAPVPGDEFAEEMHAAHIPAMALSLLVAGLGILLAFATYYWKRISADRVAERLRPVYLFLLNKWYFDELYGAVVVGGTHALTRVLRWFDNTIIDGLVNGAGWTAKGVSTVSGKFDLGIIDGLVNATAYVSGFFGLIFRKFQTGKVQTYLIYVVLGVMVFYFVLRLV